MKHTTKRPKRSEHVIEIAFEVDAKGDTGSFKRSVMKVARSPKMTGKTPKRRQSR